MMINCPKCGFNQPKDRYCASCGVDMVTYKPATKPLAKVLLGSWIFQVAVFAVLLIVVYSVFKGRIPTSLDERVSDVEDAPTVRVIEETKQVHRETPHADSVAGIQNQNQPQPSASGQQGQNVTPQNGVGATSGTSSPNAPSPTEQQSAAKGLYGAAESALGDPPGTAQRPESVSAIRRLRVVFAEVQRSMVADLINNTRNLASYGSFNGGVIQDLSTRLKNGNQGGHLRALDSASEYPVRLNQPIVVFKGARDEITDQNIGITTQIVPTAIDETGVTVQVEVLRALREPTSPQVTEQTFQETFTIPKDGGAFLAGTLPRRQLNEEEARVYGATNVLRVLTSPGFQNSSTDFLIFIEAQ